MKIFATLIGIGILVWVTYHSYHNGINGAHLLLIGTTLYLFINLIRGKLFKEKESDTNESTKEVGILSNTLWGFVILFLGIPILIFIVGILSGIVNR